MYLSDFDYELPDGLIAKEPLRPRDASRMMRLDRQSGRYEDSVFRELPNYLRRSDVLVVNDTRVVRARIDGMLERTDSTKRRVEVLFAGTAGKGTWEVMCKPGKRVREGDRIVFGNGEVAGVFGGLREHGLRLLRLDLSQPLESFLEHHGQTPLPPYIDRKNTAADAMDYQTVYSARAGAIAAPTAGLHFTEGMMARLRACGIELVMITLHVGIGTFLPVRAEDPRQHVLRPERFEITEAAAAVLNDARAAGRRIIAIGTTTTRTLEHAVDSHGRFNAGLGEAKLYILPGYEFKVVGGLLTNFHLPKSTLLMLVSAFAGNETIRNAYRHAVECRYRFYSYGDCMLIL